MTVPFPVIVITVILLALAMVFVIIRLAMGPTLLDRVMAVDVLMAVLVCALAVHTAVTGERTYVPVLLTLSLLAFIGSVSLARFGPVRDHRPFEHGHGPTGQLPHVERRRKEN